MFYLFFTLTKILSRSGERDFFTFYLLGRVRFTPAIFLRTHAKCSHKYASFEVVSSPSRRNISPRSRRYAEARDELKFAAICHSHHRPRAKGADACKKSTLVWRRLAPNAGVRRRQTSVKSGVTTNNVQESESISKIEGTREHFYAFPS